MRVLKKTSKFEQNDYLLPQWSIKYYDLVTDLKN